MTTTRSDPVAVRSRGTGPGVRATPREVAGPTLVVFRVESRRPPVIADAVAVCDVFRRRLLGVAGRRFGADAIPWKLSGKRAGGGESRANHAHAHILVSSANGHAIDRLAVWCPAGLTPTEAAVVAAVTLPALRGAAIGLVPTADDRFSRRSSRFRSHTPFLPVRHPKRRGGELRDRPQDQVVEELRRRGLPAPRAVRSAAGRWASFRTRRIQKDGAFAHLGAYGFELEFPDPISGPIALGRNSHFGMGLFLAVDDRT